MARPLKIGIQQIGYLPWLGFFDQIYRCDKFVLHIDVQFDRHSWRNRNRVRTREGWCWLTVPVCTKGFFGQNIKETRISNRERWFKKHWLNIRHNYLKARFFSKYAYFFEETFLCKKWEFLVDLDLYIINWCLKELGISTEIIISSQIKSRSTKTEGIIAICKELGADSYLSASAGRNYLDEDRLGAEGIGLEYQDYKHPVYQQVYPGFFSHLSIIDLLFNAGEESLGILSGGADEDSSSGICS